MSLRNGDYNVVDVGLFSNDEQANAAFVKFCPKCKKEFPSGKFCKYCGQTLEDKKREQQELKCSNCGCPLSEKNKFCTKCGTKIK